MKAKVIIMLKLESPNLDHQLDIEDVIKEINLHQESFMGTSNINLIPYPLWLEKLEKSKKGLIENKVPAHIFFAYDEDLFIGFVGIRHYLNADLFQVGGHIGYMVRPSMRKKGYAKSILRLALKFAKDEIGLDKVLITCHIHNIASEKTILSNGGIYEDTRDHEIYGLSKRFWIKL
jgi:predicted acetyltransferase